MRVHGLVSGESLAESLVSVFVTLVDAKLLDLSEMCSALIYIFNLFERLRRDEVIETASGLQYEAAISSVIQLLTISFRCHCETAGFGRLSRAAL